MKKKGFRFINYYVLEDRLLNKADDVVVGIDYLRLVLDYPINYLDDILFRKGVDFDNSNYYIDDNGITYIKLRLSTGYSLIANIVYKEFVVPIFLYNVFDSDRQSWYKSYGRLDIYSGYWRLIELGFFEKSYIEYILGDLYDYRVSRLDIKFDLFFNYDFTPPLPNELLKIRKNVRGQDFKIGDRIIGWSYGSSLSKRLKLRLYDKLLDSKEKGKLFLYNDYLKRKKVYRLEFELLNKFCRGYTYGTLDLLCNKFFDSLYLDLDDKVFNDYNVNSLENGNEERYFKGFVGRGKTLYNAGYNPFLILFKGLKGNIDDGKLEEMIYELNKYLRGNK